MRPPRFWHRRHSVLGTLLAPATLPWKMGASMRARRPGWRAPVPVICCGNATVGGAGKTTLALDLGARLQKRGLKVAFLTRGYGGKATGPVRVDPLRSTADQVGDEPLLLAALAPTWVAPDRAAAARAAIEAGAQVLVMDDGLQHPSLLKDLSLLVVDGVSGFGNGRMVPAGPLRETVAAAARRCQAAVLVGEDRSGAGAALPAALPVLRAKLVPSAEIEDLRGWPVLAFAGIARPEKFFTMLEQAGVFIAARRSFPDHHTYTPSELRELRAQADKIGAARVTTPKDAARLFQAQKAGLWVIGVHLEWEDAAAVERMLDTLLASRAS
jgi:tetraacyldisaccharide 4'-kinase